MALAKAEVEKAEKKEKEADDARGNSDGTPEKDAKNKAEH